MFYCCGSSTTILGFSFFLGFGNLRLILWAVKENLCIIILLMILIFGCTSGTWWSLKKDLILSLRNPDVMLFEDVGVNDLSKITNRRKDFLWLTTSRKQRH